jgi:hypothetical protein
VPLVFPKEAGQDDVAVQITSYAALQVVAFSLGSGSGTTPLRSVGSMGLVWVLGFRGVGLGFRTPRSHFYLTESACRVFLQKSILAQIRQLILYTTESVYNVVLQKSIPAQIPQLILYYYYL